MMLFYLISTNYYAQSMHVFDGMQLVVFGTIIFIAKFGITSSFNVCWSSTTAMFPAQFSLLAISITSFCARAMAFVSPQIAEIQSTLPMWLFTTLAIVSFFASGQLTMAK